MYISPAPPTCGGPGTLVGVWGWESLPGEGEVQEVQGEVHEEEEVHLWRSGRGRGSRDCWRRLAA